MKKVYLLLLPLALFAACKKDPVNNNNNNTPPLPPIQGQGTPITVNIDAQKPTYAIPDDFLGFSYEAEMLTKNPEVLNVNNKTLVQFYKNLGPGILRIGGDSSDEISWTDGQHDPSIPDKLLTSAEIDNLAAFSKATGWKIMLSLNFSTTNSLQSKKEAIYADSKLGNNLYALQIGNEPDVYAAYSHLRAPDWGYAKYNAEWLQYYNDIKSALPNTNFVGPDASYNTDWFDSFADNLSPNVSQLTFHYYRTGPASSPAINYQSLLGEDFKLGYIFQSLTSKSNVNHIPYRITECNSVYGSGKPGVSDVFASALWSLDFLWFLAGHHGAGINFHNVMGSSYSAIDYKQLTAKPQYYAMLAFRYAGASGNILPVSMNNIQSYDIGAYACVRADQSYAVTLINKETTNFSFTIRPGRIVNSVKVARLSAPGITAASGVTFAQSTVDANGLFTTGTTEDQTVNQKQFLVEVPAASAAVIIFR